MARDYYDPRTTPWNIDESEFEGLDSVEQRAKFLLRYAILAPSGHNTQPWKFGVSDEFISVYPEPARRLPVADPEDRELRLSLGASIGTLEVAAQRFGMGCDLQPVPDGAPENSLATVRLTSGGEISSELRALFGAITKRHTNRFPYEEKKLSGQDVEALQGVAGSSETPVMVITDDERQGAVAHLAAEGDILRMSDRAFRSELSRWIRPNSGRGGTGITADALGVPYLGGVTPWLIATFNSGKSQGKKSLDLVSNAGAAVVICGMDTTESLLKAGITLARLLLTGTNRGIQFSFFSLAVEVPELRQRIKDVLGIGQLPQLLLRAGYAQPLEKASPRLMLESVLA